MPTPQKKILLEFGRKVRAQRKALGLSQVNLAKKIGCVSNSISNVEYGNNFPSLPVYVALCRELKMKVPPFFA